jgi:hypothetical protein
MASEKTSDWLERSDRAAMSNARVSEMRKQLSDDFSPP